MANTCYEALMQHANRKGNLVYYNHKISIKRFCEDVEKFAFGLSQLNLNKGDVVTVYLPSCPQGVVAFYACSKLGLIANIVHPKIPLALLKTNLQKVNSKAMLFYDVLVKDENSLADLGQILIRCSIADYVTVRKPAFAFYARLASKRSRKVISYKALCKTLQPTPVLGDEKDVVCLMHSGGTSGSPKIVQISNFAMNQTAWAMKEMYHPTADETCYNLATLPIFHAYGLCSAVHAPFLLGYSNILVPKFNLSAVCNYFKKYKITCWSVVPAMLKKMLKANRFDSRGLKDLDVIWCGGDVLDEALVEQVDGILRKHCARAQLMRGYGLTEVCGVCIVNSYDNYRKNSCGKPMCNVKVQVWDESGNALAPNQLGEIVICADGNMQGYLEGDCFAQKGDDQWVLTGDIGYVDEDGFVYIVDRKKRSLKIAAVNVFPAQIEACVKQLDFVDEACAVGYRHNDKQYVKVFVTLNQPLPEATVAQKVKEICQANLITYSVPQFVEVISQMPRTPLGKIDYKALEQ